MMLRSSLGSFGRMPSSSSRSREAILSSSLGRSSAASCCISGSEDCERFSRSLRSSSALRNCRYLSISGTKRECSRLSCCSRAGLALVSGKASSCSTVSNRRLSASRGPIRSIPIDKKAALELARTACFQNQLMRFRWGFGRALGGRCSRLRLGDKRRRAEDLDLLFGQAGFLPFGHGGGLFARLDGLAARFGKPFLETF